MAREKSAAQQFADLFKLTPAEAVGYLQQRGRLTQTFDWRDLWQDEHARQFTVSRMARLDILVAMQEGITASVNGELSRRDWMRDTTKLLQREGWWGESAVLDPVTGEAVTTKFDSARLKLIFDMNTRMAYSAGLWERIDRNKASHPYVRYITKGDERVRASHRPWNNLVLPVDDPFWRIHWPPNGWRCRCSAMSMTARDYQRRKAAGTITTEAPPVKTREWLNKRTGEVMQVPVGVDPGFDYNVGVASVRWQGLQRILEERLPAWPSGVGAQFWHDPDLPDALRTAHQQAWWQFFDAALAERMRPQGKLMVVGAMKPQWVERLKEAGVPPETAEIVMRDRDVAHAFRDAKAAPLPQDWFRDLPRHLREPQAVVLDQTHDDNTALLLIFDAPSAAKKLVVRVNYRVKKAGVMNLVETGREVDVSGIRGQLGRGYDLIDGML